MLVLLVLFCASDSCSRFIVLAFGQGLCRLIWFGMWLGEQAVFICVLWAVSDEGKRDLAFHSHAIVLLIIDLHRFIFVFSFKLDRREDVSCSSPCEKALGLHHWSSCYGCCVLALWSCWQPPNPDLHRLAQTCPWCIESLPLAQAGRCSSKDPFNSPSRTVRKFWAMRSFTAELVADGASFCQSSGRLASFVGACRHLYKLLKALLVHPRFRIFAESDEAYLAGLQQT